MMKKISICIVALFMCGCIKPYHEAMMVDIETSEVAFLVETINDNGQAVVTPKGKNNEDASMNKFYQERYVNARKIEIPYYWKQTSRQYLWASSTNGAWKPAARLIVVDTAPTTRHWKPGKSDTDGIWVESKDSVGFATGISLTARIKDKDHAVTFLSNYPPEKTRKVETKGGDPFEVEVASLEQVMDDEVRTKIQEVFAYECAAEDMDTLRDKKQEIMDKVQEVIIPYFEERGITITSVGQFGGFTYENKANQDAIDKVFAAQQDKEVAIAEAAAAEERKVALKLEGEGEAEKAIEAARGKSEAIKLEAEAEAEAIQAVADAKSYELEKLQENPEAYIALKKLEVEMARMKGWDGKYPTTLFGSDGLMGQNILFSVPAPIQP